jgi:hypothetical protein
VQFTMQAVLALAFKVTAPFPPDVVGVGVAGRTQAVLQFATCALQDIMQLVVVEVRGVARPGKGVVTFGVEVCAMTIPCALAQVVAAISNCKAFRMASSW